MDGAEIAAQEASRAITRVLTKAEYAREAFETEDWSGLLSLAFALTQDVGHLAAEAGVCCAYQSIRRGSYRVPVREKDEKEGV